MKNYEHNEMKPFIFFIARVTLVLILKLLFGNPKFGLALQTSNIS